RPLHLATFHRHPYVVRSVYRLSAPGANVHCLESVLNMANLQRTGTFEWTGLAPDNSLLFLRHWARGNLRPRLASPLGEYLIKSLLGFFCVARLPPSRLRFRPFCRVASLVSH